MANLNNNRKFKHVVLVNRNGKCMINNVNNGKYMTVTDESTTMASLRAFIDVLEGLDENATETTIILVPKTLALLLKMDRPAQIRDNGYKTPETGKELTQEFVDLMCYANELRAWLTTSVVRLKLHGSSLLYPNEVKMIKEAWDKLDNLEKPQRPVTNKPEVKPERPTGFVAVKMEDIEF
jgi:predicted ribonuclease YlaK